MKPSLIDRATAPEPKTANANTTARLFDELVHSLTPGKATRVEPTGKETPRGLTASITRAAKRTGKTVRSWDVEGKVYTELVEAPPAPAADAASDDRQRSGVMRRAAPRAGVGFWRERCRGGRLLPLGRAGTR